jgi:transposase
MVSETLLPPVWGVALEYVIGAAETVCLVVTATEPHAACPDCGHPSHRPHSRYSRTLADLPWQGIAVRLRLRTRRFFCDRRDCPRAIFTERLPALVPPYGRRTTRLAEALHRLAAALGGEAGARLAIGLGMAVSPDTLRRRLRRCAPRAATPRVLGVDDFAFRRGHRYGTILVDLERKEPVDLLPDRREETVAAWLRAHPGVEIVSRDRSAAYAEAARQGAPEAVQVADRWHLLKNLAEALEAVLLREHAALRQAAQDTVRETAPLAAAAAEPASARSGTAPAAGETPVPPPDTWTRRAAREKGWRRERRSQRYREVVERQQRGESQRQIARALGLSRATVSRYLAAGGFPEIARRVTAAPISPYLPYLKQRWAEGCRNGRRLWAEIAARGFPGAPSAVYRAVALWREQLPPAQRRSPRSPRGEVAPGVPVPSPRAVVWWLIGRKPPPRPEQAAVVERLVEQCPAVKTAQELVQGFFHLVRKRERDSLEAWMAQVAASGIPELEQFSAGLRRDWDAVVAALTLPWSNGPVEGQVNRLKLIKRQMYGRAGFALLRARVLAPA